jgi:hypothetical protein
MRVTCPYQIGRHSGITEFLGACRLRKLTLSNSLLRQAYLLIASTLSHSLEELTLSGQTVGHTTLPALYPPLMFISCVRLHTVTLQDIGSHLNTLVLLLRSAPALRTLHMTTEEVRQPRLSLMRSLLRVNAHVQVSLGYRGKVTHGESELDWEQAWKEDQNLRNAERWWLSLQHAHPRRFHVAEARFASTFPDAEEEDFAYDSDTHSESEADEDEEDEWDAGSDQHMTNTDDDSN